MPRLPARRNSLCLFCAFAAPAPAPSRRLLPRIQVAHRSVFSSWKPRNPAAAPPAWKGNKPTAGHYNRLDAWNPATTVRARLHFLKKELAKAESLDSLQLTRDGFDREWFAFERSVNQWVRQETPELQALADADRRNKDSLETRLRYLFYAHIYGGRFTAAELTNQKEMADLRHPAEWYPNTRQVQRTVHIHVGPTNSGKTYHALKRLEQASTGIYLGPLRLLAHEVYTRLNAKGKTCALITGEEQRMPQDEPPTMFSCTVEMAPLGAQYFDVAVIDEIQMINHPERGWAWTQAFLGLRTAEIHLCGEARTVPLLKELCALVGDKVHIHEYERLTPLQVQSESLGGNLNSLEKGDCIVAFTVLGIHALRKTIEQRTGKNCAIVYGSLPPETRAQQARLFNDPDNDYDFLVASDAIGMGLNLAIKRVIFESVIKSNGVSYVPLQVSEVKQIAGRAGRYKTAHQGVTAESTEPSLSKGHVPLAVGPNAKKVETSAGDETVGWVTTLDAVDHSHLVTQMSREPDSITTAGLFPPTLVVERFASYFPPGTPFSYILLRLHEISEIHPRFHLCALKDQLSIADVIQPVRNLTIQDRLTICAAPLNVRGGDEKKYLRALAECIADGNSGSILDLVHLPLDVMDAPASQGRPYLFRLEQLHKMLVCYLWLSYRFPNVFTTRKLANYTKKLVEDQIEKTLADNSFIQSVREKMKKRRESKRERIMEKYAYSEGQSEGHELPAPPGMPEEAGSIINDSRAFADPEPARDDADEYPEEPLGNGVRIRKFRSHPRHDHASTTDKMGNLLNSRG